MKKLLLLLLIFAVSSVSCKRAREYSIEGRARQQLQVSVKHELAEFSPGARDWQIENVKTVYANDSICLLQCTVKFRNKEDNLVSEDYRYIYLLDIPQSYFHHKAIYNEEFRHIPCMPDNLIKKCRIDSEKDNISVYESMFGGTVPVREPFDGKD